MQRLNEREFLQEVLRLAGELPEGIGERLAAALEGAPEERAEAIRKVFEDFARE